MNSFYGLYRGIVIDNDDTGSGRHRYMARLKVRVPEVYGTEEEIEDDDLPWAFPCMPGGGGRDDGVSHGVINIPPVGASVWIGFERGDPGSPVWLGTWYGERDATPEIPNEAISDQDARYPDIFLIKFPWEQQPCYIRCSKDKKLELVFKDKNKIQFDATTEGEEKIYITTNEWDVEVFTQKGDIKAMTTEGDMQFIASQGNIDFIAAEGDIRIIAGGELRLVGEDGAYLQSPEEIQGGAPKASGFDRHP